MTKTVDYEIVGSYNNQRVSSIDAERSVNVFEYRDPLGKKPRSLINTSGLIDTEYVFGSAAGGARAQFVFQNIQYVVYGNATTGSSVFRITPSGSVSFVGTIDNTITGYVGVDVPVTLS